uniref:Formin GTPase-binding domain-containing protein n=1 Tax=Anopheles minimus TaxID=112268 RepID=A0A182VTV6_9DIPT
MSKHDRVKSGGFLDTLLGRPHKKLGRHGGSGVYGNGPSSAGGNFSGYGGSYGNLNGGRPLSGQDADRVSSETHRLTEAEVNKYFLDILEDMNIPKDKRDPLLGKPLEEKRKMIDMHVKGKLSKASTFAAIER